MAHTAYNKESGMSQSKAEAIVARLLSNAAGLKYGSVSVTAKVHNGRIMDITYSITENTRETETKEADRKGGGNAK
jgi:hypothetical protein